MKDKFEKAISYNLRFTDETSNAAEEPFAVDEYLKNNNN
ncbi:hypothetical protein LCGC14_3057010 [marine sediment metagenome]|uniref:Uncharacterized protein n=1 Tax=marine sediment metagenome TaxID=412755 RepID=A0A0F8WJX8_9ZZZZ